jgi:hypothetical protein
MMVYVLSSVPPDKCLDKKYYKPVLFNRGYAQTS